MMKNKLMLACLIAANFAVAASAQTYATDWLNIADVTVDFTDATTAVTGGHEATAQLTMTNATGYASWQGDVILPEGITLDNVENDGPTLGTLVNGRYRDAFMNQSSAVTDSSYRFIWLSLKNTTVPVSTTGQSVGKLTFFVADSVAEGVYTGKLTHVKYSTGIPNDYSKDGYMGADYDCYTTFQITVKKPAALLGDVNGDGMIDVNDVTTLVAHVLGQEPSPFLEQNADIDASGSLDVADVTSLVDMVLSAQ